MSQPHTFGYWLRLKRKALDLTRQGLAERVGYSVATIRKIEAEERRPSAQILERLAELFHIPQEERTAFLRFARGDWQAAPSEMTRAAPWHTSTTFTHSNLPATVTSLIGREQEIALVCGYLLNPNGRLVTLIGPPGIGKTRLSIEAARTALPNFPAGVCFVELASLSETAFMPQAVALALDVREVEDRPILTLLLNYLHTRRLLLVLDNCEHLVEEAAQLTGTLLRHCPHLQLLTTSREALGVPGEIAVLIPPLAVPDPHHLPSLETLVEVEAVRLFVERARAALPEFTLTVQNGTAVTEICQRLDGIPLAIELAAARVKMLQVKQIAKRLDDRFRLLVGGSRTALPRHQTLAALIDWSYDLLPAAEQRLLRWLSVFAGGFTLDAAEALCAEKDEGDALELLAQLVNKSLVVTKRELGQEARYHLLETIRQYAGAKLAEYGEARLAQSRHLAFFLQLAEAAEPRLHSVEQIVWLDRLEAEYDNLRAALAWSLENPNGDLESGLRLATALVEFWLMRSHFREGSRWLDVALEKRNSAAPPIQARLLLNAGWLSVQLFEGDPTVLLQESLALYCQLDDKRGAARSLRALGMHAVFAGEQVAAAPLLSEGLTLAGQFDDKQLLTGLYGGLALLALQKGDYGQVTELATRGLALAQETGDRQMKYHLLVTRGRSAHYQRDYARARAFFHEARVLSRELKNRRNEGDIVNSLGEVARLQRAYEQAAVFYHESLALSQEVGDMRMIAILLSNLGLAAHGQDDRPRATSLFRESLALAQEMKTKDTSLWNVWGLARVALAEGQTRRAAQLLAADGLLAQIKRFDPVDFDDYERDVAQARAQLGEEAFAAAWAEGEGMGLETAVALALGE